MSKVAAILSACVSGVVIWALTQQKQRYVTTVTEKTSSKKPNKTAHNALLALNVIDGLGDIFDVETLGEKATSSIGSLNLDLPFKNGNLQPLLNLIGSVEAPEGYNQVYGGISKRDQPKKLTAMSVEQVLAWQDSIDAKYPSEAAGRYQIMEDTLRGLVPNVVHPNDKFDVATQDKLAVHLLKRRGLNKYRAGQISEKKFANNLAKEWASLPVVTGPKMGRSYYAGDGLNKAHVSPQQILDVVRSI